MDKPPLNLLVAAASLSLWNELLRSALKIKFPAVGGLLRAMGNILSLLQRQQLFGGGCRQTEYDFQDFVMVELDVW